MLPPPPPPHSKPDGTQWTGTVQLTHRISNGKVELTSIKGCFVKNDENLQEFIKDSIKPSAHDKPYE
jgi:hypothetical protein